MHVTAAICCRGLQIYCAAGLLTIALALTGCSAHVTGTVSKPAEHEPALPIEQLVPTAEQMSRALGSTMNRSLIKSSHDTKPLPPGITDTVPAGCAVVTTAGLRRAYTHSPITATQIQWWDTRDDANLRSEPHVHVHVAVVELSTAEAAAALYQQFTDQWRQCQGAPIIEHLGDTAQTVDTDNVLNVSENAGRLTAIDVGTSDNRYDAQAGPIQTERAMTITGRFLIDVSMVSIDGFEHAVPAPEHATAVAKLIVAQIVSNT